MQEQLIIDSRKPFKFEPFCVRCGGKTKTRFYFDKAPGLLLITGLLLGFMASLILRFDKGRPWVPFCCRCRWRYASPSRQGVFHVVFAIMFICLTVYLLATERFIMGALAILSAFIALYIASRLSRNRRVDAMPFYIKMHQGRIVYTFISGHFYDKQMNALDQEEMISNVKTIGE